MDISLGQLFIYGGIGLPLWFGLPYLVIMQKEMKEGIREIKDAIGRLEQTAISHEGRISNIEGRQAATGNI